MESARGLTRLPVEILHNILNYLTFGPPSNHLATGKIDASFRGLIFTCHDLHDVTSDYYYSRKVFKCVASDLLWEIIHMNPNPYALLAFRTCMKRIERLEVKIRLFGATEDNDTDNDPKSKFVGINLQIGDLRSLRLYLEDCKTSTLMKSLVLVHSNRGNGREYFVPMPWGPPIPERTMYATIFSSFVNGSGTPSVEQRSSDGPITP